MTVPNISIAACENALLVAGHLEVARAPFGDAVVPVDVACLLIWRDAGGLTWGVLLSVVIADGVGPCGLAR
jgi:hypothetical protein